MSFYKKVTEYKSFDFEGFFNSVRDEDVERVIEKTKLDEMDFLTLLSPKAEGHLEKIAQKSHEISLRNFGKSVVLYTPIYVSNYCVNKCAYCGYNVENKIVRKKLTLEEVEVEAKAIYETGLRHIILLTGESRHHTPVSYIKDCVKLLKNYFSSICIEVYPLETEEYKELAEAGVDSITVYQEVYKEEIYDKVHLAGPKKNYLYRLDAPERAVRGGINAAGIGALLGLGDFRKEAFLSGVHALYIQDKYPWVELSLSVPRIRPHAGGFNDIYPVTDMNIVQAMLAFKLFIPRASINMTTRERAELRDRLLPLGVTKMSAGVSTEVGSHSCKDKGEEQFDIADPRSVEEIKNMLLSNGYNPILKDWECVV